jgi:AcrR family transcriptional regulator
MTGGLSLREQQNHAVRERLVAGAIAVIEAGEEPNMRSVAREAGVSERTIYRYFASREELAAAVVPVLRTRASAPMAESASGLEDYARDLFTVFLQNEKLVRALVSSRPLAPTFEKSRKKNLAKLQEVLDRAYPGAPESARRAAALALRVPISGAGWVYMADCGFSNEESIAHACWMIRTVLGKLEQQCGDSDA